MLHLNSFKSSTFYFTTGGLQSAFLGFNSFTWCLILDMKRHPKHYQKGRDGCQQNVKASFWCKTFKYFFSCGDLYFFYYAWLFLFLSIRGKLCIKILFFPVVRLCKNFFKLAINSWKVLWLIYILQSQDFIGICFCVICLGLCYKSDWKLEAWCSGLMSLYILYVGLTKKQ